MCKKDTATGSVCCKCCTPTVQFSVMSFVGLVILVVAFVIAAVILTMLQDGVNNTVRYNSPSTDSKAYNDWLSTVPSDRSTNDASFKYYSYYLFNITNLDAVVTNGMSGTPGANVIINVQEVGPYVYRKFVNRFAVSFDTPQDRLTFQEYGWYVFQPDKSFYGGVQLNDAVDVFYQPSSVYTALFGNPLVTSAAYGFPEFAFRGKTANLLPYAYGQFLNATYTQKVGITLFSGTSTALHYHIWVSNAIIPASITSLKNAWTGLATALGPAVANGPDWEYYNYITTVGGGASQLLDIGAATDLLFPQIMAGNYSVGTQSCATFVITSAGSALCFLDPTKLPWLIYLVYNAPGSSLTPPQLNGIAGFMLSLTRSNWDFLFGVSGHLGYRYTPLFTSFSCQPYADIAANYNDTNCPIYNNANMWVKKTAASLLWEDNDILGVITSSGKTTSRPLHTGYFKNQSSLSQAQLDNSVNQIGTGINHIGDVDNIYLFQGTPLLPTAGPQAGPWCHQAIDATYAPAGRYWVQNFMLLGGNDVNANFAAYTQAQSTKYSPNYPPGRVGDTNKYKLENSVIGDQSFLIDIWVSDITRHATMQYRTGITLSGIDLNRYAIADKEYQVIPFFGQYHQGLANYTCPAVGGPLLYACLPRFGQRSAASTPHAQLDATELQTSGIYLANITAPTDDQFNANGYFGSLYSDPTQLEPFLDLEPITGQAMSGSLKEQLNLMVDPWLGGVKQMFDGLTLAGFGFAYRSTAPRVRTLVPVVWLNKMGFLSDKQASDFKSLVYGAKTASFVLVIVGSIVGAVLMFAGLACVIRVRRSGYSTQTSKSDLAL